jgi:predicted phosphodiesterase
MKLYAISDLHVGHPQNRQLHRLGAHPDDWLIIAGDVGETEEQLAETMATAVARFAKVFWVPGNHELWTVAPDGLRGEAKYQSMVAVCRHYGVVTPEDPYVVWPDAAARCVIAPLFLLYDYSFRGDGIAEADAVAWAAQAGLRCADEVLLHPDPHPSRQAWCAARVAATAARLAEIPADHATVLINHFPLRRDLAVLPAIPRFSIWCGTRATEDWHLRFRARVVVSGHLHIRTTQWRDGVRFEEVSLGYPRHWSQERGIESYLRTILPAPG